MRAVRIGVMIAALALWATAQVGTALNATRIGAVLSGGAASGSVNVLAITLTPAPVTVPLAPISFLPNHANTNSAPTLNVNGLGAATIIKVGGAALASSDLTTTALAIVWYDGTHWELLDPQTTPVTLAAVEALGTLTNSISGSAMGLSGITQTIGTYAKITGTPQALFNSAVPFSSIADGSNGDVTNTTGLGFFVVSGSIAGDNFCDLLMFDYFAAPSAVIQSVAYGTPPTRTYTLDGTTGQMNLALSGGSSGTYSIYTSQFGGQ